MDTPVLRHTVHRSRLLAVAAITTASALGLTACGGTSATSETSTGATGKAVAGDTLTVGELQAPDSLNPALVPQPDFTLLTYDSLLYLSSSGKVEPGLAKSYKYIGTGNKVLQLTLRSGATFSDGSAVTAAAVKASLEYTKATPGNQSPYLADATITTTGTDVVTISLTKPNPILPTLLTQTYGVGAIMGPTALKSPSTMDAAHTSDGAGAYIYQPSQSVAGDHYTYTANPNYYDKSRQHYKTIVMKVITNESSMISAEQSGQIDVAKGDYAGITEAKSAGLQTVGGPTNGIMLSLMDRDGTISKPLANLKVRQAINYAIDRAAVTKALVGADGVATTQLAVKGGDGYSKAAASKYAYSLSKAKKLMKQAGYAKGFTLSVLTGSFAGFNDMGEAVQGQLAKIGITVKITEATTGAAYVQDAASRKYPAMIVGQSAYPMYIIGQQLYMTQPNLNPFDTKTAALTSLYEKAAAASTADRAKLDVEISDYLVDNAWFAPVSLTPIEYFATGSIGGVAISASNPTASILDWYSTK